MLLEESTLIDPNEKLNAVAGVLDGYGGIHVVVALEESFPQHVRPGQILIPLPSYYVKTPVPWNDIPTLIARVEWYVNEWIRGLNDPDIREHEAIKLYLIRQKRTYNKKTIHLEDIAYT